MVRLVLAIALLLAALTVSDEAKSDRWTDCTSDEPDRSIDGCTAIIKANRTSRSNRAIAYHNRGFAYLNKSKYEWAINDFTKAIKLKPEYASAYAGRGKAYRRTGNYSQAIADYTTAIKLKPGYVRAFYGRGLTHEDEPDYDLARRDYRKVLQLDPGHEKAKKALERLAKSESRFRGVIKDLRSAPISRSLDFGPLTRAAMDACMEGEGDMIARCTSAIKSGRFTGKDLGGFYYLRANQYYLKKDHARAARDYSKALKLTPGLEVLIYVARADSYREIGQYDRSLADFRKLFKLNPKWGAIQLHELGATYERMGDREKAINYYRIDLEIFPGEGRSKKALKRLGVTEANYNGSIKLDPEDANDFIKRGKAYEKKGYSSQAITFYDIAIHLNPKEPAAYHNRGFSHFKKGNLTKAITDYGAAIRLNPKFARAYGNRGVAFYKVGRIDRAIADFLKALDLDPSLEVVRNNLKKLEAQP